MRAHSLRQQETKKNTMLPFARELPPYSFVTHAIPIPASRLSAPPQPHLCHPPSNYAFPSRLVYFLKALKILCFSLSARPWFGGFAAGAAAAAAAAASPLAGSGVCTTFAAPPRPVWKSPSSEARIASAGTTSLSARAMAGASLSPMFAAPVGGWGS